MAFKYTTKKSLTILVFLNHEIKEWQNPGPNSTPSVCFSRPTATRETIYAAKWKAIAAKRLPKMEGTYFIWKWHTIKL